MNDPNDPLEATLQDVLLQQKDPDYARWREQYPNPKPSPDYDLYLAFKSGAKPDERGHLSDIGKRPNHITFSRDSWYAQQPKAPPAGEWRDNAFYASSTNIRNAGSVEALQEYFRKYEPGVTLILPEEGR